MVCTSKIGEVCVIKPYLHNQLQEHARIRHETEAELQMKIAELETEKKR